MQGWRWLLRAKRLAQNPPSEARVRLVIGVLVVCLLLFAIERLVGWPDWLTPERLPNPRTGY